mmetsp:Transcript_3397/g.10505  ORF Transcript_3397/g.10505 Transcript_3397/m.10505 type:complete len:99 (+) Transcript_3397:56-352(+)
MCRAALLVAVLGRTVLGSEEAIVLPVVDLGAVLNASSSAAQRRAVGDSLMAAFAELGAASVVNHGVGDTTEVLEAVRSAFADPSEAEKSDAASPAEAS